MGHVFGLMLIVWMLVGAQGRHVKDVNTDTKLDLIRVLQDGKEGTFNVTSDQMSTTTAPTTTTTTTTSARKHNPYEIIFLNPKNTKI